MWCHFQLTYDKAGGQESDPQQDSPASQAEQLVLVNDCLEASKPSFCRVGCTCELGL